MRTFMMVLLFGLAACGKQASDDKAPASTKASTPAASGMQTAQSAMPGKPAGEMEMIPVPKDKAQLARMVSMGYTVHENHMHPPGVKSCPLDKAGGSIIG